MTRCGYVRSASQVMPRLRRDGHAQSKRRYVSDGRLSAGHARALAALSHPRAQELAHQAIHQGLSVRELERLSAARESKKAVTVARHSALPPDVAEAENRLRFALATRVALHPRSAGGGTIEIQYADDGELTRILDRVAPQEH